MRTARHLFLLLLAAFPLGVNGQTETCLNPGRLELLRTQIVSGPGPKEPDATLRDQLVKSAADLSELFRMSRLPGNEGEDAKSKLGQAQKDSTSRLCAILNARDWPARASVTADGMNALMFLISGALTIRMQLEVYPLVAAAFAKDEITGSETLAAYVDRLRVALGRKQLYGTYVTSKDGFLVQAPIERAVEVDKRREMMKLAPLRRYERALEIVNRLPLIRAVSEPVGTFDFKRPSSTTTGTGDDSLGLEEGPVVKIETAFVSIDVNIPDAADGTSASLERADFQIFDNGKPVEIETFAKAETPFDIVLLLDLSGSTAEKAGLIKKTTRRFIEMKRVGDRVGVIAFNHEMNIISELEADQDVLFERIKKIGGNGASYVWDAVRTGFEMLDQKGEKNRRKAIVLMTDGVDNLLSFYPMQSERAGFADLVELIQRSSVTIFPIYLDTQKKGAERVYESARRTLAYMADQSGGTVYTAKKLDDLSGIYDRVMKGVGTVYTLGFTPDVESGGREWRTVKVEVPSRPGLKLRHRPGYFTR